MACPPSGRGITHLACAHPRRTTRSTATSDEQRDGVPQRKATRRNSLTAGGLAAAEPNTWTFIQTGFPWGGGRTEGAAIGWSLHSSRDSQIYGSPGLAGPCNQLGLLRAHGSTCARPRAITPPLASTVLPRIPWRHVSGSTRGRNALNYRIDLVAGTGFEPVTFRL